MASGGTKSLDEPGRGEGERLPPGADASARRDLETGIGRLLAGAVTLHTNGVAILNPDVLLDPKTDRNAAIHALGQVVRTVGGAGYMPALDKLRGALDRLGADKTACISLGGCVLHGRKGGICVYREKFNVVFVSKHSPKTYEKELSHRAHRVV